MNIPLLIEYVYMRQKYLWQHIPCFMFLGNRRNSKFIIE